MAGAPPHILTRCRCQWLALASDHADGKVRGYIQVSVIVLGPGDKAVTRDRLLPGGAGDGAQLDALRPQDNSDMILIPPTIKQSQEFLVVSCFAVRGELWRGVRAAGLLIVVVGRPAISPPWT